MMRQPGEYFISTDAAAGPAFVCRPLEAVARHLFTTRPWQLGSPDGASPAAWAEVAAAIGVEPSKLARLRQVHGRAVVVHRAGDSISSDPPEADIILSNDPDAAILVQTADCVPLLLADPLTGAVCAAHAGWRGLALGVPRLAVEAMTHELGARAEDLVACAGPSIGACCYEVGDEVRDRFGANGFREEDVNRWFVRRKPESPANPSLPGLPGTARDAHWYFDGWLATRDQLVAAGVRSDRTYSADLCSASHPRELCSYRRDGKAAGRMAGAIRAARRDPSPRSPAGPRAR